MSQALRSPRGRRGATATFVALVATIGCAFGAIEAIWAAVHGSPWLIGDNTVPSYLHRTHLRSTTVLIVGIAVGVVGLLLLLTAVIPAHRDLLEVDDDEPALAIGLSRRSLERSVVGAAEQVDGISSVDVKAGRRRMRVKAKTPLEHTKGLVERVDAAVHARLNDVPLRKPRRVRVSLDREGR